MLKPLFAFGALALFSSCGSRGEAQMPFSMEIAGAFAEAATWTLHSLVPLLPLEPRDPGSPVKTLRGYEILGTVEVSEEEVRARLTRHLARAADASDDSFAACFNPRHAIVCDGPGGRLELLICFECLQAEVYGSGQERLDRALLGFDMAGDFNDIYRGLGLPIAD